MLGSTAICRNLYIYILCGESQGACSCAGVEVGAEEHQAGHAAGTEAATPGKGTAGRGEKDGAYRPWKRAWLLPRYQPQPHGTRALKACRGKSPLIGISHG